MPSPRLAHSDQPLPSEGAIGDRRIVDTRIDVEAGAVARGRRRRGQLPPRLCPVAPCAADARNVPAAAVHALRQNVDPVRGAGDDRHIPFELPAEIAPVGPVAAVELRRWMRRLNRRARRRRSARRRWRRRPVVVASTPFSDVQRRPGRAVPAAVPQGAVEPAHEDGKRCAAGRDRRRRRGQHATERCPKTRRARRRVETPETEDRARARTRSPYLPGARPDAAPKSGCRHG